MTFHVNIADGGYADRNARYGQNYPTAITLGMPSALTLGCGEESPLPLASSTKPASHLNVLDLDFSCKNGAYNERFRDLRSALAEKGTPLIVGTRILGIVIPEASLSRLLHWHVETPGGYQFKVDFDDGVTTTTLLPLLNGGVAAEGWIDIAKIAAFTATSGAMTKVGSMGSGIILEVLAMPAPAPVVPSPILGFAPCDCDEEDSLKLHLQVVSDTIVGQLHNRSGY